jgi:hypothetical protein
MVTKSALLGIAASKVKQVGRNIDTGGSKMKKLTIMILLSAEKEKQPFSGCF